MFLLVLCSPRSYKESRKWGTMRDNQWPVQCGTSDNVFTWCLVTMLWSGYCQLLVTPGYPGYTWSHDRNVGNCIIVIIVILRMFSDKISDIITVITANDIIVSTRGWSEACWHVGTVSSHPAAAVRLISSDAHPLMIFLQQKFNLTRAKICIWLDIRWRCWCTNWL